MEQITETMGGKPAAASADCDTMGMLLLTPSDPMWKTVRDYAAACSWSAGKSLAENMDNRRFTDWERVIAAVRHGEVCGYCTAAKKDCIPDVPYTPYIGYVFVGEAHRGHRLSQRMIEYAEAYLRSLNFSQVYLVSDHENLYEKYGFAVIDRKSAPWGEEEKIYRKQLQPSSSDGKRV